MSDEMIIKHCSPTLAGIKTANLFCCEYGCEKKLKKELCRINSLLVKRGLRVVPLKKQGGKALIYVYRPQKLQRDLSHSDAERILADGGYEGDSTAKRVTHLGKRLRECEDFPHEIGLFLGYPPEDVIGFIENKAKNFKISGYWKVYGDEQRAARLFAGYKKCTDAYIRKYTEGSGIERLAVRAELLK